MTRTPREWLVPDWPTPDTVKALITTRHGGVSEGRYASLNLGLRVNDDPQAVRRNRALLRACLPQEPRWLTQVHGAVAIQADRINEPVQADAAYTRIPGVVCAVLIADCMPVLLCDRTGEVVAVAHAGWRGLSSGVIEATVAAMKIPPQSLSAYLGPAIGPEAFEVGQDVVSAFVANDRRAIHAFRPHAPGRWLCDLFALARRRLHALGIDSVHGGLHCTYSDPARFFSHRRDKESGRMAALIWRER
jgi:polyphenol oxidase